MTADEAHREYRAASERVHHLAGMAQYRRGIRIASQQTEHTAREEWQIRVRARDYAIEEEHKSARALEDAEMAVAEALARWRALRAEVSGELWINREQNTAQ